MVALLYESGSPVPTRRLLECMWDSPPASARANLRTQIARTRTLLNQVEPDGGQRLETRRGPEASYQLRINADELDFYRFRYSSMRGRQSLGQCDYSQAITELTQALTYWSGSLTEGLPPTKWCRSAGAGLHAEYLRVKQDLIAAELLGHTRRALDFDIENLLHEEPSNTDTWVILAAARFFNQGPIKALDVIRDCRSMFTDEYGIELPEPVSVMQKAVLDQDEGLVRRCILQKYESPRLVHSAP
ncbi:hypothetical protein JQS30_16070 [Natronoglycomyces albus]|uniref:Bacterial transcriptional activator domain-containing protein n=2 Tax=Natronoglycomyces albus TaxID=2811108 RepID=A0A895XRQ7_9ACTN|nr:hypothetical protein JQS30_16070 [Natronoglycomyces albus]